MVAILDGDVPCFGMTKKEVTSLLEPILTHNYTKRDPYFSHRNNKFGRCLPSPSQ
jgi:hypothetical protein